METQLSASEKSPSVSIDEVFKAMNDWRSYKERHPGSPDSSCISDDLWRKIFNLSPAVPEKQVRTLLRLNTSQYKKKYQELCEGRNSISVPPARSVSPSLFLAPSGTQAPASTIALTEVKLVSKPPESIPSLDDIPANTSSPFINREAFSQLKSSQQPTHTFVDRSTVVAEFIRKDGQRMKLHTTTKTLSELMSIFFAEDEVEI